jgi:hypothetical protein
MEGGMGAILGPGERPVCGRPTLGLLVIATGGRGKLSMVGDTPVPVALLLEEEVPPAAVVETLK